MVRFLTDKNRLIMNKDELIKELERLKAEYKKYSNNTSMNAGYRVAISDAIETIKKFNYIPCCEQLKDKPKLTFDEYTENFYICNGFTYESKRTGKLVDVGEITERYRWYSKNL